MTSVVVGRNGRCSIPLMETQSLDGTQQAPDSHHVFGDPINVDGVTVIPATAIHGGSRRGRDAGARTQARPAGAFIVRGGQVRWRPAIDVNRVIAGGQLVVATALLVLAPLLRRRIVARYLARRFRPLRWLL